MAKLLMRGLKEGDPPTNPDDPNEIVEKRKRGRPKKGVLPKYVFFRVPIHIASMVDDFCKMYNVSRTPILKMAIIEWIEKKRSENLIPKES